MKLHYCASWANDREKEWSGTTWSLRRSLARRFELIDIDLAVASTFQKAISKVERFAGIGDFDIRLLRLQQKHYERVKPKDGESFFQFSEVPFPCSGELHYIYQDLAVEWLLHCRESDPQTFMWTGFSGMSKRAMEKRASLQREAYESMDAIFTMGNWMSEFLVNDIGISSDKVHHVGGGINTHMPEMEVRREGNTFLFAGRDFTRKGGDLVLKAFDILHARDKNLKLLIAGPASNPALGHEGVKFVGDISNDKLGELFLISDCFVMPSRFEAYGLVFPEALACGLPCVGRRAFEMPYFIEDGINGRLIESDDCEELAAAMADCLTNSLIRGNAAEGVDVVRKKYSWDAVADRIFDVVAPKGIDAVLSH